MQKERSISSFLRRNGVAILLTAALFGLVYAIVFHFRTYIGNYFISEEGKYYSDYLAHATWAMALTPERMLACFYNGSERLWHIFVKLLFSCGIKNIWTASAIITAAADAAAYFLIFKLFDETLSEKHPRWLLAVLLLPVFLANALTLPGGSFYVGRGAINTWHNPTNIMVRPFAAAVFYMTVRIYNRRRYGRHQVLPTPAEDECPFSFAGGFWAQFRQPVYTPAELVLYPVCLLLSAYAKPSFLQFFAPAILIFLLIDVIRTKGMLLPFCIKLALAYIPVSIILLMQFSNFFGGAGIVSAETVAEAGTAEAVSSGVAIYFVKSTFSGLGEFLKTLGNALWESLYLCAFPLFILAVDAKRSLRSSSYRLGLISALVARLELLFLHETGARASHGNFSWGYYLSAWVLWSTAIPRYMELLQEKSTAGKLTRWCGSALLLWHLTDGIVYIIRILQTAQYYI